MTFDDRVRLLRGCETEVYTVCLAALEQEQQALEAAKETLCDLFRLEAFGALSVDERERLARAAALRQCMLQLTRERGIAYAHG